jgi:catechol 2,3-dioxygenase-like lactoylglutathione lyase family enzyme
MLSAMIRQIAPQFFTTDIPASLAYYRDKLGFDCISTWQEPPVYAAYLFIENADALYAEFATHGVEFTRGIANTPWHSREFVVKDCDGRLLAFGANPE